MPKIIFVAGLNESGYGTIMDMVFEGSRKRLGRHIRLGFEEHELRRVGNMLANDARKAAAGLYRKIENQISAALKAGSSVVVEGPLTLKTGDGYLPLVPKGFFESFKPDVFILFEAAKGTAQTGSGGVVRKAKPSGMDWTQQEINRSYAAMYASLGSSLFNIITVGRGGVKTALRECTRLMESFLDK
jgi:adenylate kinase